MQLPFKKKLFTATLLVLAGAAVGYIAGANYWKVNRSDLELGRALKQRLKGEAQKQAARDHLELPEGEALSVLLTNYDDYWNPQEEIREIPVRSRIYDLGFVVYSRDFALRHGYPEEYVVKLDEGMQALEFRMMSQGGNVSCYLNTLLDNDLGLDLPPHDYQERFNRRGSMMRFPKKIGGCRAAHKMLNQSFLYRPA